MSDHIERMCFKCGSYLHHEDDCPGKPPFRESEPLICMASTKQKTAELPAKADSPSGPTDNDSKEEKGSLYEERKAIAELLGWKVYSDNPNGSPYTGPCGTAPGSCHSLEDLEHLPTLGELVDVLRARLQKQQEALKTISTIALAEVHPEWSPETACVKIAGLIDDVIHPPPPPPTQTPAQ